MTRTIEAIYEDGILRPLEALAGIADKSRVKVTIEAPEAAPNGPLDCVGILPDEDAAEMLRIVKQEFEQVDAHEW